MLITVIAPTHRNSVALKSVEQMFARQQHPDKRLVIVENGSAIGICDHFAVNANVVLRSDHSKSNALNTGLDWLRSHGGGAWCCWDDDDYYGPGYLSEVNETLPGYEVIGKVSFHVKRSDRKLWLINRTGFPLGHSLASWSDCLDFRSVQQWGEDERFCQDMIGSGAKLGSSSSYHFVWQRSENCQNHAWPATDDQLAQILTYSNRKESQIVDYGNVDSYDFVDKLADPPAGQTVILPDFDPMDHPGVPKHFKQLWKSGNEVG